MLKIMEKIKYEISRWKATIEVLLDREAIEQIRRSEKDVKDGKVHKWEDVKKELLLKK